MKLKHTVGVTLLSISFVASSCGFFEVVSEEQRIDYISKMENFTWNYYTEVEMESCEDGYKKVIAYNGEGRVSKTDVMTIETYSEIETYSLSYVCDLMKSHPDFTLEEYIDEYLVSSTGTYEINEDNNTVIVKEKSNYIYKCFVALDQSKNQYEYSIYLFYSDGTTRTKQEPRSLSDEELKMTIKNYISFNQPLIEEVISKANRIDDNNYLLNNPTSNFYFANTGVIMVTHQINSIKLCFNNNTLCSIDYVNDSGREVKASISKIGSTIVEQPPKL